MYLKRSGQKNRNVFILTKLHFAICHRKQKGYGNNRKQGGVRRNGESISCLEELYL